MASCEPLKKTRAAEVMRPCATFVSSSDLITKARSIMRDTGLRTLPVIDEGKLAGILTDRELLKITSTRSNITVAGLMLPPQLIATPEQTLDKLAGDMIELEISVVPVVKSSTDMTVKGIVHLEDILIRVQRSPQADRIKVGEIMSKKVLTCSPDDEVSKVWDLLEEKNYSGCPVTRYNRQKRALEVVGVVTRSDIIRSGAIRLGEESDKGRFRSPPKVRGVMKTPAITVNPDTPLSDAIDLMVKRNVGRLPVVEKGELVGIVSRGDIIRTCIR
ncbi:MAG: hypothetical protein APU95_03540 [Hadesarchaea archaeon YNP_N21]|jgi:CBS domain-containing protein|nr:MAG: hypothetical protein APU95_03540 [Hadesarchaea archaeon YNP_N21]